MRLARFTIAQWMICTAVVAVNAGVLRAFFVHGLLSGAILIIWVIQVGIWRFLRSRGRVRRFWAGFEVGGISAVLLMVLCETFPDSLLNGVLVSYTDVAANLAFAHLPDPIVDVIDLNQDLLLAAVYFAPELLVALLGGGIALLRHSGPTLPGALRYKERSTLLGPPAESSNREFDCERKSLSVIITGSHS
jgi:hypothetical protein